MVGQRTLKNTIRASGVGLHTGKKILMTLRPAAPDTGILFRRTDLAQLVDIRRARRECRRHAAGHDARSRVRRGSRRSSTCCPPLRAWHRQRDRRGRARRKCRSWTAAPVTSCSCCSRPASRSSCSPKRFIRIKKRVKVEDGDKWAKFEPFEGFKVNFEIEFNHPIFKRRAQRASMDFSTTSFLKEISRARTFGFMRDLEMMRVAQSRPRRQSRQRHRAG